MVGLPDSAVKESHQRILSALQVTGYKMPTSNIVINMAPADIRKEGSSYDLPPGHWHACSRRNNLMPEAITLHDDG